MTLVSQIKVIVRVAIHNFTISKGNVSQFCLNTTLRSILDYHAPAIIQFSKLHKPNPWYTPALQSLKSARRRRERIYSSSHSVSVYKTLNTATNKYHQLVACAKMNFNAKLIQSSIPNPRLLWNNMNYLLYCSRTTTLPSTTPNHHSLNPLLPSFGIKYLVFVSKSRQTLHPLHLILTLRTIPQSSHLFLLQVFMKFPNPSCLSK